MIFSLKLGFARGPRETFGRNNKAHEAAHESKQKITEKYFPAFVNKYAQIKTF